MIRKVSIAVFIVLLVLGGLAGVKTLQFKKLIAAGKSFAPPAESVSAAVVREDKWQGTLTAIGSITAVQGVTVTPDIPGIAREIAFESGAVVTNGALLVRLDTSSEEAQLRALEAQEELARLNVVRERSLRSQNLVPQ
jgi:membrane fusion protein (multidrug efflux system)